jgi:hypothetical protein
MIDDKKNKNRKTEIHLSAPLQISFAKSYDAQVQLNVPTIS